MFQFINSDIGAQFLYNRPVFRFCMNRTNHNIFSSITPSEIAQVIAPYTATGAEQLTLAPGQLILIRKKNPGGWWEGELQVHCTNFIICKEMYIMLTLHKKKSYLKCIRPITS